MSLLQAQKCLFPPRHAPLGKGERDMVLSDLCFPQTSGRIKIVLDGAEDRINAVPNGLSTCPGTGQIQQHAWIENVMVPVEDSQEGL